jgi:hypothetical protein
MNPFFNSVGNVIGFESESNLFNLYGTHFARYVPDFGIYVDLKGNYFGEIISNLYLLVRDNHGYENQNFGRVIQQTPKVNILPLPKCNNYLRFMVSDGRFSDVVKNRDIVARSLDDYIAICKKLQTKQLTSNYYRGQIDSTWDLQSTLCRFISNNNIEADPIEVQKKLLIVLQDNVDKSNLRSEIYNHSGTRRPYSLWHSLSQAQHIGIPTSLIDFTMDEMFALRFALEKKMDLRDVKDAAEKKKDLYEDCDAAVFIYTEPNEYEYYITTDNHQNINPFSTDYYHLVNLPYHCNALDSCGEKNRLLQKGRFVFQNYEKLCVSINKVNNIKERFCKIIIPKECKDKMREELKAKCFPDTKFINSEMYAQSQELIDIVEIVKKEVIKKLSV